MTQSPRLADSVRARPPQLTRTAADTAVSALRRRLVALAVKLVWNRDDAEDIVQEAFKIVVAKGPAPSEARYEPWMLRTVGNLSLNLRRRRRSEPLAAWTEIESGDSPQARLERGERLETLRGAVATLPDQQQLAVVLRMMEHADYTKIAEVLDVSVSAARTHVHLGRQRLAEILSETDAIERRGSRR